MNVSRNSPKVNRTEQVSPTPRFITFIEAGRMLGRSDETARRYVQQGLLTAGVINGKRRVLRASVDALVERALRGKA